MGNHKKPELYIIAGPNGAGKTTFAQTFLPRYANCLEFINADMIAKGLAPFNSERAAIQAGKLMLSKIQEFTRNRIDFAFESTLSGITYLSLLRSLKEQGYQINIFFLWLPSAGLACRRVADRVKMGGHDIPLKVIRRRYKAGLYNFINYYSDLCDSWALFDNSSREPELIARKKAQLEIALPDKYERILRKAVDDEKV